MALTRITEGVIKPNENYVVNNINSSGVTTSTNFKTGTSNLHNVGIEIAGINVLGADTPIGTGATIYDAGGAVFTGVVTATSFSGSGNISADGNVSGVDATFTGNVSIGGTLTYEDVTNIDAVGLVTAREGIFLPDNKTIKLGNTAASPDLSIYYTGSAGLISNTNSVLKLQAKTGQNGINIWPDGVLQLHHSGSEKLETQSWGFWSHGSIKPSADTYDLGGNHVSNRWNDIFVADTGEINIGDSGDLKIWHDGSSTSYISNLSLIHI